MLLALLLITLPRYLNSDMFSIGLLVVVIVVIFGFLEFIDFYIWFALSCDLKTTFAVPLMLARSSTYIQVGQFLYLQLRKSLSQLSCRNTAQNRSKGGFLLHYVIYLEKILASSNGVKTLIFACLFNLYTRWKSSSCLPAFHEHHMLSWSHILSKHCWQS